MTLLHKQSHATAPGRMVASPCLNKSIEATHLLRLSPRNSHHSTLHSLSRLSLSRPHKSRHPPPLTMSEPPRVELSPELPDLGDLDPSAPSNRAATGSSTLPQTNGSANGGLAQSAQKTGNSILACKVRGTERLRTVPSPTNPHTTVLSALRKPTNSSLTTPQQHRTP